MTSHGPLGGWYRTHLGEPLEADHVQGYWTFLLGAFLAMLGLACFLVASTYERGADNFWLFRRIAFTLALVAGPVIVLSIVYLLPLQARAVWVAIVGLLICVGAAVAFNVFYPSDWNWGGADQSAAIMAGYGAGIALQILTVFLFPLVTSETAQPATAAQESKATFQLYEDRGGEHRWRLLHDNGNVIADGGEGYASRQKARQGMESVRRNAPAANEEVLESPPRDVESASPGAEPSGEAEDAAGSDATAATDDTAGESEATPADTADADAEPPDESGDGGGAETAVSGDDGSTDEPADQNDDDAGAFEFGTTQERSASDATVEVYRDRGEEWRWRLRHRNGNVVADSGQGYASRSGLDDAVDRLQAVAADADTLEYDPAGFERYADEAGQWRWRLRHRNGRVLADSGEGYSSRSAAREGIESVRRHASDDEHFEVYEDEAGEYCWRLTADNGEIVADGGQGYTRESNAREAVDRIVRHAPEADTLDYDPAAYELYQDRSDEWRWRLRHRNGNVLADSGEGYSSKQRAKQGMRSVMSNAPDAEVSEQDS